MKFQNLTRREYVYLLVFFALVTPIAVVGLINRCRADEEWQQFRADHHCQARSRTSAVQGLSTTPAQTTWLCDDGQTYVHNDE